MPLLAIPKVRPRKVIKNAITHRMFWKDFGGISFEWQGIKFKYYPKIVHELKRKFKELNRIPKIAASMQDKGRQLNDLLDRWNNFSNEMMERELFASRWEITAETQGRIWEFANYVRHQDLLTTHGIQRQLRFAFDQYNFSHELLPTLNEKMLMFDARLFHQALRLRANTPCDEDHKAAFIQVMNMFGYWGKWTRRNLTEEKLDKYWGEMNVLVEFEEDQDPIQEMLIVVNGIRGVQDVQEQHQDEDALAEIEIELMKKHLCIRKRRTRKIHEQGWQVLNPRTGKPVPNWWATEENLYQAIWEKAGTDWRLVYKTKKNPVPRPIRILSRV